MSRKRRAFYQVGQTSRALHKKEAQPGWTALEPITPNYM